MTPALYIKHTGEEIKVTPANFKGFTLSELQTMVNGYIQMLPCGPNHVMYVNEDGLCRHLPFNEKASVVYAAICGGVAPSPIVGDVVIVERAMDDAAEEEDNE